jgi:hypothetical protein
MYSVLWTILMLVYMSVSWILQLHATESQLQSLVCNKTCERPCIKICTSISYAHRHEVGPPGLQLRTQAFVNWHDAVIGVFSDLLSFWTSTDAVLVFGTIWFTSPSRQLMSRQSSGTSPCDELIFYKSSDSTNHYA